METTITAAPTAAPAPAPATATAQPVGTPEGFLREEENDGFTTIDRQQALAAGVPVVVVGESGTTAPFDTVIGSGSPLEALMAATSGAVQHDGTGSRRIPPSSNVDWAALLRHLQDHPEDAAHVDNESHHTPLHWAVQASTSSTARAAEAKASDDDDAHGTHRTSASENVRLRVVQRLLALNPGSAAIRCRVHGRTPLATAAARGVPPDQAARDLETRLVRTLLLADPRALRVKCHRGHDPLALHVLAASRRQWEVSPPPSLLLLKEESEGDSQHSSSPPSPSTTVLEVLARPCTRPQLERALELLVRCNSSALAHLVASEESRATADARWLGPHNPFPLPSPLLNRRRSDSHPPWPWPWICVLLRSHNESASTTAPPRSPLRHRLLHPTTPGDNNGGAVDKDDADNNNNEGGGFSLVHAVCQIVNCPPAVLYLCVRADPVGARTPLGPRSGEFPHSAVEAWATRPTPPATTESATPPSPFAALPPSHCRQALSLAILDAAHPIAAENQEEVDGQESCGIVAAVS